MVAVVIMTMLATAPKVQRAGELAQGPQQLALNQLRTHHHQIQWIPALDQNSSDTPQGCAVCPPMLAKEQVAIKSVGKSDCMHTA